MNSSSSPSSKAEDLGEPSSSAVVEARAVPQRRRHRSGAAHSAHIPVSAARDAVVLGRRLVTARRRTHPGTKRTCRAQEWAARREQREREKKTRGTQYAPCCQQLHFLLEALSVHTTKLSSRDTGLLLFSISSPLALTGDHTSGLFDLGTASGRGCGGGLSRGRSPCCRSCRCRTAARGLGARARRGG